MHIRGFPPSFLNRGERLGNNILDVDVCEVLVQDGNQHYKRMVMVIDLSLNIFLKFLKSRFVEHVMGDYSSL